MIPVEGLIFDLDGTLVDSRQDIVQAVHFIQRQAGFSLSKEQDIISYVGDGAARLLQRALPKADPALLQKAAPSFFAYYFEHALDHTTVYPRVAETLEHFRQKKMAVVTNKPARVSRRILEGLGLSSYFRLILGGDSTARKKPDPDPVIQSLKTLGIQDPAAAVMVGDGAQDIQAGRKAGTFTCGVFSEIGDRQKLKASSPDFLILKIDELMRIFN